MPRGQGKVKRKKGKAERSGAGESGKRQSCPAERKRGRENEENHGRAGHESEKRGNHAPRAGKSEEEKKENRAERGMRVRKGAIMPSRQGKTVRRGEKPGLTGRKRRKKS